MPIEIRPFSPEWRQAVREFNARLDAAAAAPGMRLAEDPQAEMLPGSATYLAVEEDAVRGGYVLRPQQVSFSGELRRVTHYRLPVSEGLIDKRYALVGSLLLRSALKAEPALYALGMGGEQQPLPRMLQAQGWRLSPVPFYFRVVHARRFLEKIRAPRQGSWRAAALNTAARTAAGSLTTHLLQWSRTTRPRGKVAAQEASDFGAWADEIWEASHRAYGMVALRDAETLRQLYPAEQRFLRLRLGSAGWVVLLDTAMQDDQYFGDLRVGTIVDCLAQPEDAAAVIHAARRYLEGRGVDLIISNQAHAAWTQALRADGFFKGPSNFLFGASKPLSAWMDSIADAHINRGDGDGPVHL